MSYINHIEDNLMFITTRRYLTRKIKCYSIHATHRDYSNLPAVPVWFQSKIWDSALSDCFEWIHVLHCLYLDFKCVLRSYLGTDLVAALTSLDVDDFTHLVFFSRDSSLRLSNCLLYCRLPSSKWSRLSFYNGLGLSPSRWVYHSAALTLDTKQHGHAAVLCHKNQMLLTFNFEHITL